MSAFEDDHPNTKKQLFHVVILVKGVIGEKTNQQLANEEIVGSIYSVNALLSDDGWETLVNKAVHKGESLDRATFSTFNWSTEGGQKQGAVVVSWSKTHEDMLIDTGRGGCSCTIF